MKQLRQEFQADRQMIAKQSGLSESLWTAFSALSLSLFIMLVTTLAAYGYYRWHPHYLSERPLSEVSRHAFAGFHAFAEDNVGAEAFIRSASLDRPVSPANQGHGRPEEKSPLEGRYDGSMMLLASAPNPQALDVLFNLAFASIKTGDHETEDDCLQLRDVVREAALRYGISASALSVEAIRPSGTHAGRITRFTVFLTEEMTAESLYEAIEEAAHAQGARAEKEVLSNHRTLIRVAAGDVACVDMLCVVPVVLDRRLDPPPAQAPTTAPAEPSESSPQTVTEEDVEPVPAPLWEPDGEPVHEKVPEMEPAPVWEPISARDVDLEEYVETRPEDDAEEYPVYEDRSGDEEPPLPEIPPLEPGDGKIATLAIILDDGGYGGKDTERILELDNRLTLAILPDTPFARETAEAAAEKGFEIMLHMPMQAGNGRNNHFPGELQVTMTREEIQERTRACIAQFPEAVGVNNHTGGLFTTNAEKMRWCLEVVQEENLYFIDSRTIGGSRAYDVAVEMGIPSAGRDLFLDHHNGLADVRKRFRELVALAKARGWAVGIGHFRPNTVRVLTEELPKLEAQGVVLVPASELVW